MGDAASPPLIGDSASSPLMARADGSAFVSTFVMVAHGGELEAKAALLAASIRAALGPGVRIVVAVPGPAERWGALSGPALAHFCALGAELVETGNEIDPDYPHGNKVSAMQGVAGAAVFLDSDMIMLRPLFTHWSLLAVDAAAKVADINTFQRGGGDWRPAYRLFGLSVPTRTVIASETGERMPPYYNAGFVCVSDAALFARTWTETAQALDADRRVRNKRPWLDQIALPITFARLGWTVSTVPDQLNFPGHVKPVGMASPYILHYHEPHFLLRSLRAADVFAGLLGRYGHLGEVLRLYPVWSDAAAAAIALAPRKLPEETT